MKALVEDGVKIDGFIAPGHVTAITGTAIYNDLASVYKLGVVVSGFEPVDMMQSVLMLARQIESGNQKWKSSIRGSLILKETLLPGMLWMKYLN